MKYFSLPLVAGALVLPAILSAAPEERNHLAEATSPYLRQHADNPVHWYQWGEEAFAAARERNKPIFLSVGYSTCHWCHVMNRESFSDPKIAALMNENFVNIKLDREERPDVDRVYMTFVQATTGSGGWPLNVWLTPDLEPIVGGTYFPPKDAYGRPGFPTVIEQIATAWAEDEEAIREEASQTTGRLRAFAGVERSDSEVADRAILTDALAEMEERFDAEEGGFGGAPKFPRPSELQFLFAEANRLGVGTAEGKRALEMATFTLEKMARGGIHDHLGGGFHRYSVDAEWRVPHFEKMLYDQAQLAEAYLIAFQLTGRKEFADTARDILDYVLRDLTGPEGGFFSAEDADSVVRAGFREKAEGAFYVWTPEQIRAVLGEERGKKFEAAYGVESGGNAGNEAELLGKNVLIRRGSTEGLAESRKLLFEAREKRPRPHRDDKVLTAWNGLMISALAKGARVLGDDRYLVAAQRAAKFIRGNLFDEATNRLGRAWRGESSGIPGFAEDYAFLIRGLIDLYESDFKTEHLAWARSLQTAQDELFWDNEAGGYFSSVGDDPGVLIRMKEFSDGAEPSPNTVAALNLLRLSHLLGDEAMSERAAETVAAFAEQMKRAPLAAPIGLVALDALLSPAQQIVVVGPRDDEGTEKMVAEIWRRFLPRSVWVLIASDADRDFFGAAAEFYESVGMIEDQPTAYVCEDFTCRLPTNDFAKFQRSLSREQ